MNRVLAVRLIKPAGRQTLVWEGETAASGLIIRYGSEGRRLRTQHLPLSLMPGGDLKAALLALAEAKCRQGYQRSWQGYREAYPPQWFF